MMIVGSTTWQDSCTGTIALSWKISVGGYYSKYSRLFPRN